MTTATQLRKAALAQEGVEQVQVDGRRAWAVGDAVFAALDADGRAVLALADPDAARMASELDAVEQAAPGVVVDLAGVNGMALNFWVHEAWKHVAPSTMTEAARSAARAATDADDDFPAVGRPARRALHGAGIGSLDALALHDRAEVEALHGIGPRAVRLLADALHDRGVDW